jgi:isopenicillin N synthase-like dioxygenase
MGEILECVDLALGLDPKESLSQHHNGSMFVSNLIRYPRISAGSIRSGELIRDASHSDLSTLSLHFQHDVSGLQVADMSTTTKTSSIAVGETAKFYDVELNPKLIIVNVGFLLMRWTNKRWKNSVHRVSCPPSNTGTIEGSIPDQHGIAFYGFPNAETTIAPLSSCSDEDVPDRPDPFVAGEYLIRKRVELYT